LGARSAGGEIFLRIEDVDNIRCKPEYALSLVDDMRWLGLDWDYGPGTPLRTDLGPCAQSLRLELYAEGVRHLDNMGLVYPCFCSRRELRFMGGAPHAGEGGDWGYMGTCRALSAEAAAKRLARGDRCALRLRFAEQREKYLVLDDLCQGRRILTLAEAGGDFALRRSDNLYAYQLAVVMDDIAMGINQVVRGVDIVESTPRQRFLYACFGAEPPSYAHVPLVLDHEGCRLSKRHGAIGLRAMHEDGVKPEAIIGFLAWWSGLRERFEACRPLDLLEGFSFRRIKKSPPLLPPDIGDVLRK
jgi:glutamyl-tRNA synthetase